MSNYALLTIIAISSKSFNDIPVMLSKIYHMTEVELVAGRKSNSLRNI